MTRILLISLLVVAIVAMIAWAMYAGRRPIAIDSQIQMLATSKSVIGLDNPNNRPIRIYFAGALFSFQEIAGNALLAQSIFELSNGKYECILPQNFTQEHSPDVREQDLKLLRSCDCLLANANGTDLDSGTVVEFMAAIMYEKPCVVMRTDFRGFICGPGDSDQLFNPMMGKFPGARYLNIDALALYKAADNSTRVMTRKIARKIIAEFDSFFPRGLADSLPVNQNEKGHVDTILGI